MTRKSPEIRLDVLIKSEKDYYSAHCLQFDLVVTDDTLEGARQAIIDVCVAPIQFSYENDNIEYLFSPAPKEAWAEYYLFLNHPGCSFDFKELEIHIKKETIPPMIAPFIIQEVLCDEQTAC